jgi:hypothetical protein
MNRVFISPMGEPFRPGARDDDTLADWFRQADRNHDGVLTLQEMQQDAERFFALLDVGHDGEIDPDDITRYETEIAPEIGGGHFSLPPIEASDPTGSSGGGDWGGRHGGGGGGHRGGGGGGHGGGGGGGGGGRHGGSNHWGAGEDDSHQGAARFGLFDLPEPVVSADADFNRGVSLPEFRQAATQRFIALDVDHQGRLSLALLESMRPPPPATGVKPSKPRTADESAMPDNI